MSDVKIHQDNEDVVIINHDELVDFVTARLIEQGYEVTKELVEAVFEADYEFLKSKGVVFDEDELCRGEDRDCEV